MYLTAPPLESQKWLDFHRNIAAIFLKYLESYTNTRSKCTHTHIRAYTTAHTQASQPAGYEPMTPDLNLQLAKSQPYHFPSPIQPSTNNAAQAPRRTAICLKSWPRHCRKAASGFMLRVAVECLPGVSASIVTGRLG